jgi:hypothetical protein
MVSQKCILCPVAITSENDSGEHLIPNAIGGRRKIPGFICRGCNSKSGEVWDAALAAQLNPLSLHFGITRQRKVVPSQDFETMDGGKVTLHPDGSMGLPRVKFEKITSESGTKITINARTDDELRKMLKDLKGKYPQIDIEKELNAAVHQSTYLDAPIKFSIDLGDKEARRSIVKSALALAVDSGIDPFSCKASLDYLTKEDGAVCCGCYYEKDLVKNRPDGKVFHCVALAGDPKIKQLIGYVEYFGVQRMIICLSNGYEGEPFDRVYAIDPVEGKEIGLEVNIVMPPEDMAAAFRHEKIPAGSVEAAFHKVMPASMQKNFEQAQSLAVQKAVEYAWKKCGLEDGQNPTPEQAIKINQLAIEKLMSFISHHSKRYLRS